MKTENSKAWFKRSAATPLALALAMGAAVAFFGVGGPHNGSQAFAQSDVATAETALFDTEKFDPDIVRRGLAVWKDKVNCASCHGWSGNGVPDDPRQPVGANLRETALDHEQLMEVIQCGRPGTEMPHFDSRAYKDDRCYGSTAEDLGEDLVPPQSEVTLIKREIDMVATYIEAMMVGRGAFTQEECDAYFGEGTEFCATLMINRGAPVPGAGPSGHN